MSNITTATDLHFIFIKSPTVTYDPNGGKEYIVERTYNTNEAKNVYSFKPVVNEESYTFISPYISHAAEGQNDGWKFMGWLLTGDTVDNATIPDRGPGFFLGCSYEYAYPPREVLFTILLEKRVEYAIIVTNKKYVEPDCEGTVFVLLSTE